MPRHWFAVALATLSLLVGAITPRIGDAGARHDAEESAVEFRPGIIPLRPLLIGDIYGAVLKAVRGNPAATIGLATLTTFLFLLPTTALGAWLASASSAPLEPGPSSGASDTLPAGFGIGLLGLYLPTIGQAVSGILLAGFLAQVVGQAVLGRKVGLGETWRATRGRLLPMVGAVLLTGIYHVPRNDSLADLDPTAPVAAHAWDRYVEGWTAWNHVRALTALAGTALLLLSLR